MGHNHYIRVWACTESGPGPRSGPGPIRGHRAIRGEGMHAC